MRRRFIQIALGLICAAFFFWLAFSRTKPGEVIQVLAAANPWWIALAMLVYAGNLLLRSWRWSIILRQVQYVPLRQVVVALLVGYGVNNIIPARLGELFRAEYFKQRYGLSRVWALSSIIIERLLDGIVVTSCLGIGLLLSGATTEQRQVFVGVLLMAGALFGALLLAALILGGSSLYRRFERWPKIRDRTEMVTRGLDILRGKRFPVVIGATILVYVPDTLSIWLIVKSVGVTLGFADTLVLVGIASLSTLLPSGPGFLGTLQLAYALTMALVGASPTLGIAAATLAQLCLFLPVALIAAFIVIFRSGMPVRTRLSQL